MSEDPRMNQLLDELVDTSSTPEEICGDYPDLLPEVRDRLRQMRLVQAELNALFPTPSESHTSSAQDFATLP
jgi:eukaryotic-like serine/threonine-protein kinase